MSEGKYSAPALDKGLDILEVLANQSKPIAQKDLAEALGRTSSELFRMLMTLVARGYVHRTDDDRYQLTLRMFSLSHRFPPLERLLSVARPQMDALVKKFWQSCHIGIEDAGNIVIVASAPSPGNWTLMLQPGSVIGLTNTSTGRILAAFRPEEEAVALFRAHRSVDGEPGCSEQAFLDRLSSVRSQGEEIVASDTTQGVTNMAFPVFGNDGRAIAVVNCPFLRRLDTFDVPNMDEVASGYRLFAKGLSDQFSGTPFGQINDY